MTSRRIPIFDGHNDVLSRLYRRSGTDAPRAFLEGEAKGHLDLPMAQQGGFAGGLFAIFAPSTNGASGPNGETPSRSVSSDALLAPAVELVPAQKAVFSMVSLLLRIERESQGMRRWDEPSSALRPSSPCRSCPDCIIATRGFDFREGQVPRLRVLTGAELLNLRRSVLPTLCERGSQDISPNTPS